MENIKTIHNIIHTNWAVGATKHGPRHCYNHFSRSVIDKLHTTSSKYTVQSIATQAENSWKNKNRNKIKKKGEKMLGSNYVV